MMTIYTVSRIDRKVTYSMETLDRGINNILDGTAYDILKSHHATQNDVKYKTRIIYLCNFLFVVFRPQLSTGKYKLRE